MQSSYPHDVLDTEALLARVGGDEELLRELVGLFFQELTTHMDRIHQAVASGDADLLHAEAHTLKGSVGNLSAERALEAARHLEVIAVSGDLTSSTQAVSDLVEEMERLKGALAEVVANLCR